MSVDHYENFPVASVLCPPALRPAVVALYHYARTADDIADEGQATPEERRAQLQRYRAALIERLGLIGCAAGGGDDRDAAADPQTWPHVFEPLAVAVKRYALPTQPLLDLLDAFEQDTYNPAYATRAELLDYCRRSANPVGRLLLHLYQVDDPRSLAESDAICTALQLINFWQDLGVDTRRGRLYIPLTDCARLGVSPDTLMAGQDGPAVQALVRAQCDWARAMMQEGAPLARRVPGRAGWELRLVVQGGLRILDRIAALGHASLQTRPALGPLDIVVMAWRALWMRSADAPLAQRPA